MTRVMLLFIVDRLSSRRCGLGTIEVCVISCLRGGYTFRVGERQAASERRLGIVTTRGAKGRR